MTDSGAKGAAPEFDRTLGGVFNDVAGVYDRVRPTYPDEMFGDLVAITA